MALIDEYIDNEWEDNTNEIIELQVR